MNKPAASEVRQRSSVQADRDPTRRRDPHKPAAKRTVTKDFLFEWVGKDRAGRSVRGEMRAMGINQVQATLRRQGVKATLIKKRRSARSKRIKPKDIALFTRQFSTMLRAGVPALQALDIVGRGNPNPSVGRLINDVRSDVEVGNPLSVAFRKHPQYFSPLYCNLVDAGEAGGVLEQMLDRLATYMEKIENIKSKIKSALMYPTAVIIVAFLVVALIMIFVIPAFKNMFSSFGADLPVPTLIVMAISEFFVQWWWLIFGAVFMGGYFFLQSWKRSAAMQYAMDRLLLRIPIFGPLVEKSAVARWCRTLSTMFAAGVPLVEALDSVGGASGNKLYEKATSRIQSEVATGSSLTSAMTDTGIFPSMVLQMTAIGEESGSVDHMLAKSAEFYEQEVDTAVEGLSSLMEPIIIVILGVLIGGIVIAMYLPIFKMGSVV